MLGSALKTKKVVVKKTVKPKKEPKKELPKFTEAEMTGKLTAIPIHVLEIYT